MRVRVLVRLKAGVLDVQGKAVEGGVRELGFNDVTNVRIGKLVEFDVNASTLDSARPMVEELCKKLLVNPIIESFEIQGAA